MTLSDRGINYEKKSMILEVTAGEVIGKYGGHKWNCRYPRHMTQLQPKILLYRSVAYSNRNLPLVREQSSACPVPIPKHYKIVDDISAVHLENIRRNLERRLQVAKENGDENLVNLLYEESQQLTF